MHAQRDGPIPESQVAPHQDYYITFLAEKSKYEPSFSTVPATGWGGISTNKYSK